MAAHPSKSNFILTRRVVALLIGIVLTGNSSAEDRPVSFLNDVMPILTKAGCNMGVCHAKAGGGQNGFQLSLLGFEPLDDYDNLTRQGRGRRLFPGAPDHSLILQKAIAKVPHGGGVRLDPNSESYKTLRRWIHQGAPLGDASATAQSIDVQPARGTLQQGNELPLKVIAKYSDGSTRDVTEMALFETNDSAMAQVSEQGVVAAQDLPGKFSVMVRYQGKVNVFSGAVPLGAPVETLPEQSNFVDEHVFANLKKLGIPPSDVCDDATFLRRVTLDVAGRIPTESETAEFFADTRSDKRKHLIDRLLRSPSYADFFANKWTSLLKNRRDNANDITSNFAFHAWIRDSLLANVPYDQIVRELLAATGTVVANPPVAWYKRVKDPKAQLEDVAQLFLGVRMQCAQCHHHPFERWSQDDYYGFAAFFSQVGRKPSGVQGEDLIFHKRGVAGSKNMKTGKTVLPAALGDAVGDIPPDTDPRLKLAQWMSDPQNPFFAKAVVNRYWKHFFKRGLIEPEDDIRDSNPPTNPELLAELEKHFVESGFDLRQLVRVIVNSTAYQLSAEPNESNAADVQNYSRYYPRRMQAEVLLDSIDDLTGATTNFANLPIGTRAVALPDNSYNKASPLLKVFGRPESNSVCECERRGSASLAQSLHLMNARDIKSKLATRDGRADRLSKSDASPEDKIGELYMAAFSRSPNEQEIAVAKDYLNQSRYDKEGKPIPERIAARDNFQDLVWALINTKEFLFNH